MKALLVVVAILVHVGTWGAAYAHGDHKPKHGGIMGRGDDDISVELVMEKGVAVLHMDDESGVPFQTENVKGTITVAGLGRPPQEAKLVPGGDSKMTAAGLKPVAGDRLRAHIILPTGAEYQWIFSFR